MVLGRTSRVAVLALLSLCLSAAAGFTHLSFNVCRWCEASSPVCRDSVCVSNCSLSSFCSSTDEICIAIWRKFNETMTVQTMCHHPALPLEGVDPTLLQNVSSRECHMVPQPTEEGAMMVCGCKGVHECNDRLIFDKGANGFSKLQSREVIPVVLVSLVPPVLVALVATAAFYFYRTRRFGKPGPPARPDWPGKPSQELYQALDPARQVECGESIANHQSTESNAKIPTLNNGIGDAIEWQGRLTTPLPIKLETLVGKGRFAEVWKARLVQNDKVNSHETVAVKVFPAMEYASWRNECSIYSDPKLQHENIVTFLAAEERGGPGHGHRKYWLVLAYHSLGNLQEFLTENALSWEELIAMATSVAKGLAHLHSDTTPKGVPKVPIAHRDLKSSNIVVKSRQDCALCDFGLALRLDVSLTVDDYANSGQVGTARYMAPEVLESRVNLEDLEAFKQIDVYSMALVLWEMASRCQAIGEVKSFEPAFGSKVCDQPCVDSMRDLVLRDRGRPEIPSTWTQHQGMSVFCSTVTECWDHDPEARLTADCVVERFTALQNEDTDWQNPDLNQEEVQGAREESGLTADLDQQQEDSRDKDSDFQSSSISQNLHSSSTSSFQGLDTQTDSAEESRLVASIV
uniref:Serine/threonine-protein kinase receptor n=1 Tax=Neogobius melanostomus TaxID=47308 RepID=A0A8C6SGY3_9GOBI